MKMIERQKTHFWACKDTLSGGGGGGREEQTPNKELEEGEKCAECAQDSYGSPGKEANSAQRCQESLPGGETSSVKIAEESSENRSPFRA